MDAAAIVLEDDTVITGPAVAAGNGVNGKGVIKVADGAVYTGDLSNCRRHGYGKFTLPSGVKYIGSFNLGARHGFGTLYYPSSGDGMRSCYSGEWCRDRRRGHGFALYPAGFVYDGGWDNDVKCGSGRMFWPSALEEYVGDWQSDRQHGNGVHTWYGVPASSAAASRDTLLRGLSGASLPGSPKAVSRMIDAQHEVDGHPDILAIRRELTAQMGSLVIAARFRGSFVEGRRTGYGVFEYANGATYQGFWQDDVKHGPGVYTAVDGAVFFGLFEHDKATLSLCVDAATTPGIERSAVVLDGTALLGSLAAHAEATSGDKMGAHKLLFQLRVSDLLPSTGPVSTLGVPAEEAAFTAIVDVVTRWNTPLRGWYAAYAGGDVPVWALPHSSSSLSSVEEDAVGVSGPGLHDLTPTWLARAFDVDMGSADGAPVLRLFHMWRFVQDCGLCIPGVLTLAHVDELLLGIKARQVSAAVRAVLGLTLRSPKLSTGDPGGKEDAESKHWDSKSDSKSAFSDHEDDGGGETVTAPVAPDQASRTGQSAVLLTDILQGYAKHVAHVHDPTMPVPLPAFIELLVRIASTRMRLLGVCAPEDAIMFVNSPPLCPSAPNEVQKPLGSPSMAPVTPNSRSVTSFPPDQATSRPTLQPADPARASATYIGAPGGAITSPGKATHQSGTGGGTVAGSVRSAARSTTARGGGVGGVTSGFSSNSHNAVMVQPQRSAAGRHGASPTSLAAALHTMLYHHIQPVMLQMEGSAKGVTPRVGPMQRHSYDAVREAVYGGEGGDAGGACGIPQQLVRGIRSVHLPLLHPLVADACARSGHALDMSATTLAQLLATSHISGVRTFAPTLVAALGLHSLDLECVLSSHCAPTPVLTLPLQCEPMVTLPTPSPLAPPSSATVGDLVAAFAARSMLEKRYTLEEISDGALASTASDAPSETASTAAATSKSAKGASGGATRPASSGSTKPPKTAAGKGAPGGSKAAVTDGDEKGSVTPERTPFTDASAVLQYFRFTVDSELQRAPVFDSALAATVILRGCSALPEPHDTTTPAPPGLSAAPSLSAASLHAQRILAIVPSAEATPFVAPAGAPTTTAAPALLVDAAEEAAAAVTNPLVAVPTATLAIETSFKMKTLPASLTAYGAGYEAGSTKFGVVLTARSGASTAADTTPRPPSSGSHGDASVAPKLSARQSASSSVEGKATAMMDAKTAAVASVRVVDSRVIDSRRSSVSQQSSPSLLWPPLERLPVPELCVDLGVSALKEPVPLEDALAVSLTAPELMEASLRAALAVADVHRRRARWLAHARADFMQAVEDARRMAHLELEEWYRQHEAHAAALAVAGEAAATAGGGGGGESAKVSKPGVGGVKKAEAPVAKAGGSGGDKPGAGGKKGSKVAADAAGGEDGASADPEGIRVAKGEVERVLDAISRKIHAIFERYSEAQPLSRSASADGSATQVPGVSTLDAETGGPSSVPALAQTSTAVPSAVSSQSDLSSGTAVVSRPGSGGGPGSGSRPLSLRLPVPSLARDAPAATWSRGEVSALFDACNQMLESHAPTVSST